MTFIMSVRTIANSAFGKQPGATRFLKVPGTATPTPDHRSPTSDWVKQVMDGTKTGEENDEPVGDILLYAMAVAIRPKMSLCAIAPWPYDRILTLSNARRIGVSPRAGRIGLPKTVPDKAVDVFYGDYYQTKIDRDLNELRKAHTRCFEDHRFFRDVRFSLAGEIDQEAIPGRLKTNMGNLALDPRS